MASKRATFKPSEHPEGYIPGFATEPTTITPRQQVRLKRAIGRRLTDNELCLIKRACSDAKALNPEKRVKTDTGHTRIDTRQPNQAIIATLKQLRSIPDDEKFLAAYFSSDEKTVALIEEAVWQHPRISAEEKASTLYGEPCANTIRKSLARALRQAHTIGNTVRGKPEKGYLRNLAGQCVTIWLESGGTPMKVIYSRYASGKVNPKKTPLNPFTAWSNVFFEIVERIPPSEDSAWGKFLTEQMLSKAPHLTD